MTLKKFFSPIAAILIVLSAFWLTGLDTVVQPGNDIDTNIRKYAETQQRIVSNYVKPVSITKLYKSSIKGLVSGLDDTSAAFNDTPLDTSFSDLHINNLVESIQDFKKAYLYVQKKYPNQDMTQRTADAIKAMMDMLDPHSVYIEPSESKVIASNFEGSFSGVGIMFNVIQDTITVITTISGGPSDMLGIQSGDKIIAIEDSSAIGFSNEDVRNTLRGPKGSDVDVAIKRSGRKDLIHLTITRDEIPLYTVDTAYMVDDKTGYIKINRFAATTHEEFIEAMDKLGNEGMKRLVIDLRNNPGGFLGQAIAIASEFFPKGTEIVSTRSRHLRFTDSYSTKSDGKF
ncbi:MAG TPA: S41 family peptidase, partial [Balneolaceae bacterium]|nr:S41 family peptidase [Balneolaceae bacterium]